MADSSKTEQATPRRRNKAREQGQVARSRDLPGVFALAAVAGMTMLEASGSAEHWITLYRNSLDTAAVEGITANGPVLFWCSVEVLRCLAPVLLTAMLFSVLSGISQGGVNFAPEALSLKFERLNPATRLGQIFSPVGLSNMLKSLLPFGAILWIAILGLRSNWQQIVHASSLGLRVFSGLVGSMIFTLTWKAGLVLAAWAGVDYFLTLRKMNSDLMMTKQEVREEFKETEGNPVIKSRVRQLRRTMRRKFSLKAVATATVIVTNPTHFAVALRYETEMAAPVVVAKGQNLLAEKIKEVARELNIMMVENKPLAQALYKSVEVGEAIPAKLYQAVAELLALVFRAQAEVRRAEAVRRARNASGQPTGAAPKAGKVIPGRAIPGSGGPGKAGPGVAR